MTLLEAREAHRGATAKWAKANQATSANDFLSIRRAQVKRDMLERKMAGLQILIMKLDRKHLSRV